MIKKITAAFIITILFYSCQKKDEPANPVLPPTGNIYVAGFENNANYAVAKYWKNGVAVSLTNGTNDAAALDIFVKGEDVYVAGFVATTAGNCYATYWKNGVPVYLTNGSNNAKAQYISVSGNDIYVFGFETISGLSVPKLWKNGIGTTVTAAGKGGFPAGLYVSNTGDVHLAYNEFPSPFSASEPYYKKNGVSTLLTSPSPQVEVFGMTVAGTDVYIAGRQRTYNFPNYGEVVRYWKNGSPVSLSDSTKAGAAYSIHVDGPDVLVAGYMINSNGSPFAVAWKNGIKKNLGDTTILSQAEDITSYKGDVYIAGWYGTGNSTSYARYWKNDTVVNLTNGLRDARAQSIFIY